MSVLLLRTLTRKSVIGWGHYIDLTVQNLLDMNRRYELLHIYYTCRNIDYNQDIKDELCIHGDRELNKKVKVEERYLENTKDCIFDCLREIDSKKTEAQKKNELNLYRKMKCKKRIDNKLQEEKQIRGVFSRGAQKHRNQRF